MADYLQTEKELDDKVLMVMAAISAVISFVVMAVSARAGVSPEVGGSIFFALLIGLSSLQWQLWLYIKKRLWQVWFNTPKPEKKYYV